MDAVEQKLEDWLSEPPRLKRNHRRLLHPEESQSQDPILADIGTQFAAMRQLMEEK